jgi:molybdate-binding protein
MPMGEGKYDDMATYVMKKTGAHSVIVAVIGGDRGTGFSMQTDNFNVLKSVPDILRTMADEIEASK